MTVEGFATLAAVLLYGIAAVALGYWAGAVATHRRWRDYARKQAAREVELQTEVHRMHQELMSRASHAGRRT